jgi:hypothetical protein
VGLSFYFFERNNNQPEFLVPLANVWGLAVLVSTGAWRIYDSDDWSREMPGALEFRVQKSHSKETNK